MENMEDNPIKMYPIADIEYTPIEWGEKHSLIEESVRDIGYIINPITLTRKEDGKYKLETGRVRLQVATKLGWTEVPGLVVKDGESIDYALHENLMRRQLPWPEEVAMIAEYHQKKQDIHGVAKKGRQKITESGEKVKTGWTIRDTSESLGQSVGKVHGDIALHIALQKNPHLAKIGDKKTALRLIRDASERYEREALAAMPDDLAGIDFEFDRVINGDSSVVMKMFPDAIFDACITDPPWTLYKDATLTADNSTIPVFKEIFRTLKQGGFLYMVVSMPDFINWTPILRDIGFSVQQYPCIWQKTRTITHGRKNWQYARDYEPIILAVKGNAMLTDGREKSAVFNYPNLSHQRMIHPHEKPMELIKKIINDCTFEGGKVLDPFGGSGVLGQAAKEMMRKYIIIERDPQFYNNIVKRLAGEEVEYIESPIAERNV